MCSRMDDSAEKRLHSTQTQQQSRPAWKGPVAAYFRSTTVEHGHVVRANILYPQVDSTKLRQHGQKRTYYEYLRHGLLEKIVPRPKP